ncbi:Na/Pi cotransporter family protein [Eleftheria terrae]|uniref:Na/Pi cotransporter family protein n=1 Tax=Eleftheria terrae TaxID=1597781 RepID=UPI00263AE0D5|nr:Na/Pi symporter [Eleftheria terrae]WKB55107.1 Na/Pi symporter [Eleftheria terrae]
MAMGATFAAGLALFLWAIARLAISLQEVAGDRLKSMLKRAAGRRAAGLLSGTAATVVLDSSSATIILVIALVDAQLIGFAESLPVILGSNIGTTFSSQVFALNVDLYAPVLLILGLAGQFLTRHRRGAHWSEPVFYMGAILFALTTIGHAMEPLGQSDMVKHWLKGFSDPVMGVLVGAAATVAIQSSSAMMAIVITLASQQLIGLEAGLALMLGAEIGTCADTLLATLGRSAAAIRAGVFHLGFNLTTAAAGVALLEPLTALARASAHDAAQQIANAHVAFNVLGALIFIGGTRAVARMLVRLVPEPKPSEARLSPAAET